LTRVSWLLPVRDGAAWLGRAVRSALDECTDDDEVVVVDDGSRDDPAASLPPDPRIVLLRQPPLGISAALEAGRARCRGRWIARLDADDEALPGRIDAQLAAFTADPGLVAVGGRGRVQGEVGEGMARYIAWINGCDDPGRELLVESPLFHPATTIRADALAAVGGWRDLDGPEDYDLWLRLVAAGGRLGSVPREVVLLRDRPERLTRTDPRYRPAAFLPLKQAFLRDRLRGTVAVWGANKGGRPWIRWLVEEGIPVVAAYDIRAGGSRHGVSVYAREAVRDHSFDALLVAVGARGARAEIREMLTALRPDLVEGRDWWAVC